MSTTKSGNGLRDDLEAGWSAEAYERVAKWSFWLPLVTCLFLGAVARSIKDTLSGEDARFAAVVFAAVYCVLFLISLAFGIMAVAGSVRHGPRGILGRGLCGIAFSLVLLGAFGLAAARSGGLPAQAKRHASEKSTTDAIVEAVPGADQQLVRRALTSRSRRLEPLLKEHDVASATMTVQSLLDVRLIRERKDVHSRIQLAKRYLRANDKLLEFLKTDEAHLKKDMEVKGVSADSIKAAMHSFSLNERPAAVKLSELCSAERKATVNLIGMLEILDQSWGKWRHDARTGEVVFDHFTTADEWNRRLNLVISPRPETASTVSPAPQREGSIRIYTTAPPN